MLCNCIDCWCENILSKGKDNNMTQINVSILGGKQEDYARQVQSKFSVDMPKFNTGAKVKFYLTYSSPGFPNWKQGVIYAVNKKVTISKTGDEKEFKADNLQWFYTIVENGNLKTWNGIKEETIKIDDIPDYNKYFKMLGAYGLTFKEGDFTIIYWEQAPIFNSWAIVTGYNTNVTLKPKFNDNKTNLSFWTNDYSKLPTIKEKC